MHYGSTLLSTTNMAWLTLAQWHAKLILSIIIHLLTIVYMSEWESLVGKHSWYKPVFGTASRVRNPYYVLMPNTIYPSHLVLQCGGNSSSPSEWANIPISRLWAFSRNVAGEVSSAVSSCQMSYSCPHTSIAYHATIPQGVGQGLWRAWYN